MFLKGTTIIFYTLSRLGELFWTVFPIIYGLIFIIVISVTVRFTVKGKLIYIFKKLNSLERKTAKNGLDRLKNELKVQKLYDKGKKLIKITRREPIVEIVLFLTFALTSAIAVFISDACFLFLLDDIESIVFMTLIYLVYFSCLSLATIFYLIKNRSTSDRAIDYLKNYKFTSLTYEVESAYKPLPNRSEAHP